MRRPRRRHRTVTRSARVIAACLLVVTVVAGVLGGVHGLDVVTAPTSCILLADLSRSWLPCGGSDAVPRTADVAPLLPPRAPPLPRFV